ncbi:MAG TPA: glycine cleavage system aminomethyltransferase GcvT [Elusimicrobiales bacterium]|nr:glycine cleavage system aminomethyltransferase GcvT [Elusimicrobiales bacterium]
METATTPKKTALNQLMKDLNGKMVDFHGWELPIQFGGIISEHKAVRNSCGLFDVSHMGNIFVEGKDAHKFVQTINSNDVKPIKGRGVYSHVLNEHGGAVDDVIAFCINEHKFYLVVNATTTQKDYKWFTDKGKNFDVTITNKSDYYQMIALQGPKSAPLMEEICPDAVKLARFHLLETKINDFDVIITRTGYTGEDGFEIAASAEAITVIFKTLLEKGKKFDIIPCGLGARDTLRLEAGYLLYGQDTDDNHTPYEAGYGWVVKLKKDVDFVGKPALLKQKEDGIKIKLTGFELIDKGVARNGCEICKDAVKIGTLTSATFSPSLGKSIGVGYVPSDLKEDETVEIMVHSRSFKAKATKVPFYKNKV